MNQVVTVPSMSNQQFLEKYAKPGRVGLVGGSSLIDRAIRREEKRLDQDRRWSHWSHALLFGEVRSDGFLWVIESDLQAARKHIRFGVQENRITKYFDEPCYPNVAVLDFHLPPEKTTALISAGLDLMANGTRYSIRELFGTLLALRQQQLRNRDNLLAREKSLYCSALIQHLFCRVGVELTPGISTKVTTPEDLYRSPVPHCTWVLHRHVAGSSLKRLTRKLKSKLSGSGKKQVQIPNNPDLPRADT